MLLKWIRPLYAADDGGSGGDDPPSGDVRPSDVLQRYGNTAESALRLAEKLAEAENSNYKLREKNRTLRQERDALQAKVPGEGSAVLTTADVQELEAYRALGKPADLKTTLDKGQATQEELAGLRRTETIRTAAEATGYKAAVLGKLPSLQGKELTLRDVQEDGKTVKRAFVGDEPLTTYIEANDAEFLPALTVEQPQGGTAFIPQGTTGKPAGDLAARYIEQQQQKRATQTNPLMKQG